ncbi:MAG: nicotinate-nucleotide adenylyltransferase [Firmicutes bacterium]|nr:nicotinate-nucleotide adenylyltransferase [Bacillota bacterium]MCL5038609.1 nicotinate-nucleotide adenylyltransferase [Bacillota bacterium]
MPDKSLGIMGGTFNPIHFGHLAAAEAAREAFGLERVIFVPSGRPPHKDSRQVVAPEHRYLMTLLATLDNPSFEVSRLEIDRPGPSFTIDTLRQLRDQFGESAQLFFVTGADAVAELPKWRDYEQIRALAQIIAVTRPGYPLPVGEGFLDRAPGADHSAGGQKPILTLEVPSVAISSHDLRRRVRLGLSLRYLIPDPVRDYIYRNRLYLDQGREEGT